MKANKPAPKKRYLEGFVVESREEAEYIFLCKREPNIFSERPYMLPVI